MARREVPAATDYLIVEYPRRLVVYNKYQQQATAQELESLPPFAPIRILKTDDLFGDGFTRCMQVEFSGEIYYLLKGADGVLSRSGPLGVEEIFRNTLTLLDTVDILRAGKVRFSPVNATPRSLRAGQRVVRVFQHYSGSYCKTVSNPPAYGWIDFRATSEGRDWNTVRALSPVSAEFSREIFEKIRARLEEANIVLARLFVFFNSESGQQKDPPRWEVEISARAIACTLVNTTSPNDFQQSTDYLAKDLQNIVLGSPLKVRQSAGRIEILLP